MVEYSYPEIRPEAGENDEPARTRKTARGERVGGAAVPTNHNDRHRARRWRGDSGHGTCQLAGRTGLGIHTSLAPTSFDPAETPGIITPFMVLYALHDAMVKPMPRVRLLPAFGRDHGRPRRMASLSICPGGAAKFHNGDPVTAEDVKFSFERYRGSAHDLLKARVSSVAVLDPERLRFKLNEP